jgi:hypothetical protein
MCWVALNSLRPRKEKKDGDNRMEEDVERGEANEREIHCVESSRNMGRRGSLPACFLSRLFLISAAFSSSSFLSRVPATGLPKMWRAISCETAISRSLDTSSRAPFPLSVSKHAKLRPLDGNQDTVYYTHAYDIHTAISIFPSPPLSCEILYASMLYNSWGRE